MTATTHYLRHRRNTKLRAGVIACGWFLTKLSIYLSSALMIGYMAYIAANIL